MADETIAASALLAASRVTDISYDERNGDMLGTLRLGEQDIHAIVKIRLSKEDAFFPTDVSYLVKIPANEKPQLASRVKLTWALEDGIRLPDKAEYSLVSVHGLVTTDWEYRFEWKVGDNAIVELKEREDNDWLPQIAGLFERQRPGIRRANR